MHAMYLYLLRV